MAAPFRLFSKREVSGVEVRGGLDPSLGSARELRTVSIASGPMNRATTNQGTVGTRVSIASGPMNRAANQVSVGTTVSIASGPMNRATTNQGTVGTTSPSLQA